MFRFAILAALAGFSIPAQGAFQDGTTGPVALGMGGASCALMQSPWGTLANPSLLSSAGPFHLAAMISPHRFGLSELATGRMLAIVPTAWGTFAGSVSHEGFGLYREIVAGLSGGWQMASGFHAGVSVRYFHLAIAGYGMGHAVGIQVGFLLVLNRVASFGFSAGNINAPVLGRSEERLPQTYRTGVSVSLADGFEVAVDLAKDVLHPLQVQSGFQYRLLNELIFRAGTGLEPSSFGAGLGLRWSDIAFDYAFNLHPVLGLTHFITAGIEL